MMSNDNTVRVLLYCNVQAHSASVMSSCTENIFYLQYDEFSDNSGDIPPIIHEELQVLLCRWALHCLHTPIENNPPIQNAWTGFPKWVVFVKVCRYNASNPTNNSLSITLWYFLPAPYSPRYLKNNFTLLSVAVTIKHPGTQIKIPRRLGRWVCTTILLPRASRCRKQHNNWLPTYAIAWQVWSPNSDFEKQLFLETKNQPRD